MLSVPKSVAWTQSRKHGIMPGIKEGNSIILSGNSGFGKIKLAKMYKDNIFK